MIKFKRVKEDDLICDLKAGDIVVVDENYDWDPDKCILIGKVIIDNEHSMYKEELEPIEKQELVDARGHR
jgi:hypothetical protein